MGKKRAPQIAMSRVRLCGVLMHTAHCTQATSFLYIFENHIHSMQTSSSIELRYIVSEYNLAV